MKKWLDNYGKKENANEGRSSASKEWIGEGYSNVGRSYSPAWGGQFEEGGEISKAQKGKTLPPIYTDDPELVEDYNDSLHTFLAGQENLRKLKSVGFKEVKTVSPKEYENYLNSNPQQFRQTFYYNKDNIYPIQYATNDPSSNIGYSLKQLNLKEAPEDIKLHKDNTAYFNSPSQYKELINPATYKYTSGELNKERNKKIVNGKVTEDSGWKVTKNTMQKHEEDKSTRGYLPLTTKPVQPYILGKPPEPTLNKQVTHIDPISAGSTMSTPGLRPIQHPNIQMSGRVPQGDWNVEYLDPDSKKTEVKHFISNEDAEKFYNDPANKASRKYSNASSVGRMQLGGNVYPVNYVPQAQEGLTFLEPNSPKLPIGYANIPSNIPSSELAQSIGGEDGEPAFLIPTFKYGHPLENPDAEFRKTGEHLGGPFKTWQEADTWDREIRHPYVEKGQDIPTPLRRWGKDFAMGGSLPGSVGFTYARTNSPAPSNGPHAKKTKASAQNGQEMSFYQHGLDWKPKTISKNGGWLDKYVPESKEGDIIKDNRGQWAHPGEITEIDSNRITMQGVPYPVLGISDTGHTQMMYPGEEYKFKGKKVTEFPMAQDGTRMPIYTTDPKKIQAYADSLALHNVSLNRFNLTKKFAETLGKGKDYNKSVLAQKAANDAELWRTDITNSYGNLSSLNKKEPTPVERIENIPLSEQEKKGWDITGIYSAELYKKPVQPYILKKEEEPTLKRKPVKMETIKSKSSTTTPGLKPMSGAPVKEPPIPKRGEYRVSYYNPDIKDWSEQAFETEKESNQFADEMSKRGYGGSAGNVTQTRKVNKKENGGWLDTYK